MAGLEVVRTLNESRIDTVAPLEVVVWTDEEGARFGGGTVGSDAFVKPETLEKGLARKDIDGVTVGEALAEIGYAGDVSVGGFPVEAFFETHIEQGPILERDGVPVGVVMGAQGARYFTVTVDGERIR